MNNHFFALSDDVIEYVLECQRELPESERIVFLIRPLTTREFLRLQDKLRYGDKESHREISVEVKGKMVNLKLPTNANEIAYERVLLGLQGWRNFMYKSGSECPFDQNNREANLNKLRQSAIIAELSNAIDDITVISEEEAGN